MFEFLQSGPNDQAMPQFLQHVESYYTITMYDLAILLVLLACGMYLQVSKKGPSMSSMREFVNLTNTRGGNIVILGGFSVWFFSASMRLFYHAFAMIAGKSLTPDDAILLMGLQFVTGAGFGGAFGSMLKTMTGSDGQSRATDLNGDSSKSTTTTTSVSATATPAAPNPPAPPPTS